MVSGPQPPLPPHLSLTACLPPSPFLTPTQHPTNLPTNQPTNNTSFHSRNAFVFATCPTDFSGRPRVERDVGGGLASARRWRGRPLRQCLQNELPLLFERYIEAVSVFVLTRESCVSDTVLFVRWIFTLQIRWSHVHFCVSFGRLRSTKLRDEDEGLTVLSASCPCSRRDRLRCGLPVLLLSCFRLKCRVCFAFAGCSKWPCSIRALPPGFLRLLSVGCFVWRDVIRVAGRARVFLVLCATKLERLCPGSWSLPAMAVLTTGESDVSPVMSEFRESARCFA